MNEAQYHEFLQKKIARQIQREQGIKYTIALRVAQAMTLKELRDENNPPGERPKPLI